FAKGDRWQSAAAMRQALNWAITSMYSPIPRLDSDRTLPTIQRTVVMPAARAAAPGELGSDGEITAPRPAVVTSSKPYVGAAAERTAAPSLQSPDEPELFKTAEAEPPSGALATFHSTRSPGRRERVPRWLMASALALFALAMGAVYAAVHARR